MIDLDKLRRLYRFGKEITLKEAQLLIRSSKTISIKKRETFIEYGSRDATVYYIAKGLVRVYGINDEGEEVTFKLIPEHNIVVNADIVLNKQPSRFYYESLEDTRFYAIDYDLLQSVVSNHPKLEANRKFILLRLLKQAQDRVESFVLLSPEKRYLKFIEEHPDLTNRVQDKYIAHVLGITPVSLSRIRKRIASRD